MRARSRVGYSCVGAVGVPTTARNVAGSSVGAATARRESYRTPSRSRSPTGTCAVPGPLNDPRVRSMAARDPKIVGFTRHRMPLAARY